MAWVKFNRDFPWLPNKNQTILYKKGQRHMVTTACAAEAIRAGAAESIERPAEAPQVTIEQAAAVGRPARRKKKNGEPGENQEP